MVWVGVVVSGGWFRVGDCGSGCEVGVSPVGKIDCLLALTDF